MMTDILIKAGVLLGMICFIGLAFAFKRSIEKDIEKQEEQPKSTFIPHPGPPQPKPDHYGSNIKVNVVSAAEARKAQEIKEAIDRYNVEKTVQKENRVALAPREVNTASVAMAVKEETKQKPE